MSESKNEMKHQNIYKKNSKATDKKLCLKVKNERKSLKYVKKN